MPSNNSFTESTPERYKDSLTRFGANPRALKWKDYAACASRYRQLVADLDLKGMSILDAGCGMGDLLPFLYDRSSEFSYVGVDITPQFIEIANERYTGHTFRVADPFDETFSEKADVVICSGVLNSSTPDQWLAKRKEMIRKLFELADKTLAFNMAGGMHMHNVAKNIAYADSLEILDFCSSLTNKIILRNHYHPKDFTIVMCK